MVGRTALLVGASVGGAAACAAGWLSTQRRRRTSVWRLPALEPVFAAPVEAPRPGTRHPPYGYPVSDRIICKDGFVISYDARTRLPRWVYERLTAESLQGSERRRGKVFREEAAIEEPLRARLVDYAGSGYDRGHMAAAGNLKGSAAAMRDSFSLANVAPQDPELNREYWNRLECFLRGLAREQHCVVHVFTGPLFLPKPEGEDLVVSYKVLGAPRIAVPTHFFKVVLVERDREGAAPQRLTAAFVVPNQPVPADTPLATFLRPTDVVERLAGVIFFPGLQGPPPGTAAAAGKQPPPAELCAAPGVCELPAPQGWSQPQSQ